MRLIFDIGGTKTRIAVSKNKQSFENSEIFKTPKNLDFFEKFKDKKIKAVCGGIAGILNKEKTTIIKSPNLKRFENINIKKNIEKIFNTPVILENDASLAGIGEAVYGAGKKYKIIAYFTISTGVGGAIIKNKKINSGIFNSEPGHQIINNNLTLEQLVSGSGLKKRFNKSPEDIQDNKIWDQVCHDLATGLYNSCLHWSPEIIILNGPIINRINLKNLKNILNKKLYYKPKIKKAELGDLSGLYGAMAL